jgi:hypothetical protein
MLEINKIILDKCNMSAITEKEEVDDDDDLLKETSNEP